MPMETDPVVEETNASTGTPEVTPEPSVESPFEPAAGPLTEAAAEPAKPKAQPVQGLNLMQGIPNQG